MSSTGRGARVTQRHAVNVIEAFQAASFGAGSWVEALTTLASATGSRGGELIGLGTRNSVPFNWTAGMDPEWPDEFRAIGGGNPAFNPNVRAGSAASELEVLTSADFVTRGERRSSPFFAEHCKTFDIPHICLSPLIKSAEMLVGLAVMRSASEGEIRKEQRELFQTVAPHIRTAVRTQIAIEHQGAYIMAATLEAVSISAFVCNWSGIVKAMTPTAELLVSQGESIQLKGGLLSVTPAARTAELADAIRGAAYSPLGVIPVARTIVLESGLRRPLILEVFPVPRRDTALTFDPRVLVVVRDTPNRAGSVSSLFKFAYGLSPAEVEIAKDLMAGLSPADIAAGRCVSTGTVRCQVQSIFSKLNIHSVGELLALVTRIG